MPSVNIDAVADMHRNEILCWENQFQFSYCADNVSALTPLPSDFPTIQIYTRIKSFHHNYGIYCVSVLQLPYSEGDSLMQKSIAMFLFLRQSKWYSFPFVQYLWQICDKYYNLLKEPTLSTLNIFVYFRHHQKIYWNKFRHMAYSARQYNACTYMSPKGLRD